MTDRSKTMSILGDAWTGFSSSLRDARADAQVRLVGRTFGSLIVITLLAGVGTIWLARATGDGPLPGDASVFSRVEGLLDVKTAVWIGQFGSAALLLPLVVTAAIWTARSGRGAHALTIFVGFVGSKIIGKAAWAVWDRTRPGGVLDGLLAPDKPSFPSGHVLQTVIVYGLLAAWWASGPARNWERVFAWTIVAALVMSVSVARIRTGAHWASDCLAAILVGAVWLAALIWAQRGFEPE